MSAAAAGALCPSPGVASTSAHSRAPSSRVHFSTGLRFGALRRRSRSRSSESSLRALLAVTLADLVGAAAGDVAPAGGLAGQRRALVGLLWSAGRSVPGLPRAPASREVLVLRGGPGPAAPDREDAERGAAERGAADVEAPESWGRRCGPVPTWVRPCAHRPCAGDPSDRRSCRSPATVPLLHLCAAGTRPAAATGAGPARPAPSCGAPGAAALGRSPVAAAGRSGLAPARRSPTRAAAGGRTSAGRPLPCPAPPERAGRPDPPDRADGARRFGWEEFGGIG